MVRKGNTHIEICAIRAKKSSKFGYNGKRKNEMPFVGREISTDEFREDELSEFSDIVGLRDSQESEESEAMERVVIAEKSPKKIDPPVKEPKMVIIEKRKPRPALKQKKFSFLFGSKRGKSMPMRNYSMDQNLECSYPNFGEPSDMELHRKLPKSSRNDIVIQVEASTVSFTDILVRRNLFAGSAEPFFPQTAGVDCVGTICYAGDLAQRRHGLKVGDRVCALHEYLGGNSRFVSLPAHKVYNVPESVDASEAACIVRSYLVAIQVLYRAGGMRKKVQKDHTIIVTGANGAIGRAVIELSKRNGAIVYASCNEDHRDFILDDIGADHWLDEDPSMWPQGLVVDIIVDTVCFNGNPRYLSKFLKWRGLKLVNVGKAKELRRALLKQVLEVEKMEENDTFAQDEPFATICGVQFMPKKPTKESIYSKKSSWISNIFQRIPSIFRSKIVDYNLFESIEERPDLVADDLSLLFHLLETDILKPTIQLKVSLDEIPEAHYLLETGGLQGTIVCNPNL